MVFCLKEYFRLQNEGKIMGQQPWPTLLLPTIIKVLMAAIFLLKMSFK
jgi:hypothetical protein